MNAQTRSDPVHPDLLKIGKPDLYRMLIFAAVAGAFCLVAGMYAFLVAAYGFGCRQIPDLAGAETLFAGLLILSAYLITGAVCGMLLAWTGLLKTRTQAIEDRLQDRLDKFIPRLTDKYKIGAAGIEIKTVQRLLETDGQDLFALFKDTKYRFSPVKMLHDRAVKKIVTLFRLGFTRDFIDWMGEQEKSHATVSELEAFGRERLVRKVAQGFDDQVSGIRKRIITVLAGMAALPLIVNVGFKLYVPQFPGPFELVAGYTGQLRKEGHQASPYPETLKALNIEPDCRPQGQTAGVQNRFEKRKPHANIYLMGAGHPEKAVLTSAITRILCARGLALFIPPGQLVKFPEETERGLKMRTAHVEYNSTLRHYAHAMGYEDSDDIKNLITGAVKADGVLLLVSAAMGLTDDLRRRVELAGQCGIRHMVVYIDRSKDELDANRVKLLMDEVKKVLKQNGFSASSPIIPGDSLMALKGEFGAMGMDSVAKLVSAMDAHLPDPIKAVDQPFMMPVKDRFMDKGQGLIVTGRIKSGRIRVGEKVDILGLGPKRRVTVDGVQMFRKLLDQGQAGDNVGLLFKDLKKDDVIRGQVVSRSGAMRTGRRFEALVYMFSKDEGGRQTAFSTAYRPQFYFWATDITGTVTLSDGVRQFIPGSTCSFHVELVTPTAMKKGTRFVMREGGRTVGAGVVTGMLEH